jgi:hypothetical protein
MKYFIIGEKSDSITCLLSSKQGSGTVEENVGEAQKTRQTKTSHLVWLYMRSKE